jgi:hypothetical protein
MESLCWGRLYYKLTDSAGVLGYTQISNTCTDRPHRGRTKHNQYSIPLSKRFQHHGDGCEGVATFFFTRKVLI